MGFTKQTWTDRSVEFAKRYTKVEAAPYTTFTEAPGTVYDAGTAISAVLMNGRESAIYDAYYGNGNTIIGAITTNFTYSSGKVSQIDELESSVLHRRTAITYTGDYPTSINTKVYSTDGITVLREFTDTISYSGSNISSIARTVIT